MFRKKSVKDTKTSALCEMKIYEIDDLTKNIKGARIQIFENHRLIKSNRVFICLHIVGLQ